MGCYPPDGTTCFDESSPCPNGFGICSAGACICDAVCGDGIPDPGEDCDLGPLNGQFAYDPETGVPRFIPSAYADLCIEWQCNPDCTTPRCGDGYEGNTCGEECDDGNNADGDGCSAYCTEVRC